MRIQAYFYLWKNTVSEVSLKALNETLIKVKFGLFRIVGVIFCRCKSHLLHF